MSENNELSINYVYKEYKRLTLLQYKTSVASVKLFNYKNISNNLKQA